MSDPRVTRASTRIISRLYMHQNLRYLRKLAVNSLAAPFVSFASSVVKNILPTAKVIGFNAKDAKDTKEVPLS